MPLSVAEATKVVSKNFDRIHYCSEHLAKTNLYVYVHERNLYRKIIAIYEAKKRSV